MLNKLPEEGLKELRMSVENKSHTDIFSLYIKAKEVDINEQLPMIISQLEQSLGVTLDSEAIDFIKVTTKTTNELVAKWYLKTSISKQLN